MMTLCIHILICNKAFCLLESIIPSKGVSEADLYETSRVYPLCRREPPVTRTWLPSLQMFYYLVYSARCNMRNSLQCLNRNWTSSIYIPDSGIHLRAVTYCFNLRCFIQDRELTGARFLKRRGFLSSTKIYTKRGALNVKRKVPLLTQWQRHKVDPYWKVSYTNKFIYN